MALQLIGTLGSGAGTPGVGVPTGGTTGQVLVKSSATNYATAWATLSNFAGTADNITDGTTKVIMTSAERSKLTNIASSATANSTDAQLRDRGTHTGSQAISTIVNLTTSLSDLTARSLPAGGTAGQVLTKLSGLDYAASWGTPVVPLNGVTGLWKGTQAQYDAIATPVSSVIYVIAG
jgi:hypothetical protein